MYTYLQLQNAIAALRGTYDFIRVDDSGRSVEGRTLYYLRIGRGRRNVLINASHHGMEYITTAALMRFVGEYAAAFYKRGTIGDTTAERLFDAVTLHLMPMVNPDGVTMQQSGLPQYARWQANARGVDLNHNYDAGFEIQKEIEKQRGIGPGPTRYSGPYPLSEPESRWLADLTVSIAPAYVIALHSQGEVIYWQYNGKPGVGGRVLADIMSRRSGYALDQTVGYASYGGYKDWFIKEYNRPGQTVEVGRGVNPLPDSQLPSIYRAVLPIFTFAGAIG